jgi:hypothetical protein
VRYDHAKFVPLEAIVPDRCSADGIHSILALVCTRMYWEIIALKSCEDSLDISPFHGRSTVLDLGVRRVFADQI